MDLRNLDLAGKVGWEAVGEYLGGLLLKRQTGFVPVPPAHAEIFDQLCTRTGPVDLGKEHVCRKTGPCNGVPREDVCQKSS